MSELAMQAPETIGPTRTVPVLEIDRVSKRYGDVIALRELSFQIRGGELFGFVGSNGAGKTTAMRIVLGVLAADSGQVRWQGAPITFETRRRIGYLPEERGLYPKMRVGEQLEYLAELHGMGARAARHAAGQWIDRLGLGDRRRDEVQKLSLGNQQRVQLPERSMTAVVGPSGAGKTTILSLVARFWDPDAGSVRIGGVDLREIGTDELYRAISVVFQEPYLFQGSILDNIAAGRPEAERSAVLAAGAAAGCDEFAAALPAGYDTLVGEDGGPCRRVSANGWPWPGRS